MKLVIVGDSVYAGRLTECIQKHAPDYLEVFGCRSFEELSECLVQECPDILLYEKENAEKKQLPEYLIQIQLTDDRKSEQNDHLDHRENSIQKIFRYQKGSEILRQIFQIYERSSKKSLSGWCRTADLEMAVFYAPGGHELQLPFSIAYASVCGESGKVLYLNFAEFSGMGSLLGNRDGKTFSDLIYGIRQKKDQFQICLQGVLHHTEKFDYVLPPENPEDLYEIQEEDLECLLNLLQDKTEYKLVVWNCGALNQAAEQIMECSSKVFCVVKDKSFGKYRKTEFEKFLQREMRKRLREKVQYVTPQTGNGTFLPGVDMMSQIQSGEFAKQARQLITENL